MAGKMVQMAVEVSANLSGNFLKAFSGANDAMRKMQDNVKGLNGYMKSLEAGYKAGAVSAASYAARSKNAAAMIERQEKAQQNLGKAMEVQQKIKDRRQVFQDSAWSAKGAAVAVVTPAMSMETAMVGVKKAVAFDTPAQFKEMQADIIGLTRVVPLAAEELTKIVAAGGRSGIAREELIGFAESAVKMGSAFDISADDAAAMMAKWRTAFKLSQPEVTALADQIDYLGNNNADCAAKIAGVMRCVGPLGASGSVAAGEAAALGAAMLDAGVESEAAADGIQGMMAGLTAGENATNGQAEAFSRLGLDAGEMAQRMRTDAAGAITEVMKRMQGLDGARQADVLQNLFGADASRAIVPLLGNLDNLQEKFSMVADKSQYSGSVQEKFSASMETTEAKLQLAENAGRALQMQIGGYLLPVVQKGAEWFAIAANTVDDLTAAYPGVTKWITVGTGALSGGVIAAIAFAYAILGLLYPFAQLWTFMQMYQGAMKLAAVKQWIFNASLYGCPVVWIVAGIMAVVAAGYLLYKNWDMITAFMSNEWQYVCGIIGNEWDYVVNCFASAWESIKNGAVNAYHGFIAFWQQLPSVIAYALGFALGFLVAFITNVPVYFSQMVTTVGSWLSALPGICYNAGMAFMLSAGAWLTQMYTTVTVWISNTVAAAGAFLMNLPMASLEAGLAFIASIEQWAMGAYDAALNWIAQIPDMVIQQIADAGSAISGWWDNVKVSFGIGFAAGSGEVGKPKQQLASGGIFGKGAFITSFAEDSPEAAIPLDGSPRAIGLWQQAGEMLGMNPAGAGGSIAATFAPQIHIAGNVDAAAAQQIQQVLQDSLADFERKLNALQNQKARVSYG